MNSRWERNYDKIVMALKIKLAYFKTKHCRLVAYGFDVGNTIGGV